MIFSTKFKIIKIFNLTNPSSPIKKIKPYFNIQREAFRFVYFFSIKMRNCTSYLPCRQL